MTDQLRPVSTWTNWARNQSFVPFAVHVPSSESDVATIVADARRSGQAVRAAGSGHSFTPVVETPGRLLDMSRLSGVLAADGRSRTARILGGTPLSRVGEPLWRAGLSLQNQGDTDGQTIAGAVATGTKGSGPRYGSFSSTVRAVRLVDGRGEIVEVDGTDPEVLHAAQVSLGLLGVVTELTLECLPAYRLREANAVLGLDELLDVWETAPEQYRHFSFFWAPHDSAWSLYGLPEFPADHVYAKFLTELPVGPDPAAEPVSGEPGSRQGRAYAVYPDLPEDEEETDPGYVELEHMVERSRAREAFLAIRTLMRERFPKQISPVQVRWQGADEALLSAQYHRDTVSISVSGIRSDEGDHFLRAVDAELLRFGARPHWGKANYLTAEQVRTCFPRVDDFLAVRRRFDPDGVFLTPYLRRLLDV
ncbi:D-arabinono-1,4-lactone oxidase [Pseudonocardia nematodicida]|uniref:D-arabinono-1,4-lactone oxidase n=1 Tax=Pseudonocardia nematodicida TaxID=1206997 RepID=A0ABV1KG60_9PSEU